VQTLDRFVIVAQPLQFVGRDLLSREALVLGSQSGQNPVLPAEIVSFIAQLDRTLALDQPEGAKAGESNGQQTEG
jgi:EAL domain-containing protein (putative c-di-GMP-specific phosphodiesterase class I)